MSVEYCNRPNEILKCFKHTHNIFVKCIYEYSNTFLAFAYL